MNQGYIPNIIKHRYFTLFTTAVTIALYSFFLYTHTSAVADGYVTPVILLFILMETVVIYLLVTRSQPTDKTTDILPWIFALIGTFLPFILYPYATFVIDELVGTALMVIGSLLAVGSYLSLNQSFGISPSLRTVKTNGLYQVVRHPMYASYVVLYLGYLLLAFSPYNLLVILGLYACLIIRAHFEETILQTDQAYQTYTQAVRYRIIPFIY